MPSRLGRLVGFGVVLGAIAGFGDASALRASSGEAFSSRWSAEIEGELIGFEVGNDRVYAGVHDGSTLEVVAFDLADGTILWRQIVADVEEPSRYAGGAVDNGFLLSFEEGAPPAGVVMVDVAIEVAVPATSAPGPDVEPDSTSAATEGGDGPDSHLILLDGVSGEIRWDEPLYDPATYVSGQENDHVAVVGVYDSGPAFVDLDTAESVLMQNSPDSYWLLVGEELAQFENGSLELGLDPFDSAMLPTPVPLPSGTDSVTANEDGRLIVATVGSDVVGIVDGEEVWTWTQTSKISARSSSLTGSSEFGNSLAGPLDADCSPRSETASSFRSTRFPVNSHSRTYRSPLTERLPSLESSTRHLTCILGTNVYVQQLWSCGPVRQCARSRMTSTGWERRAPSGRMSIPPL
jgi:hypothetical protein